MNYFDNVLFAAKMLIWLIIFVAVVFTKLPKGDRLANLVTLIS